MVLVAPQSTRQEGRAEVLALLREGSGRRPRFDPGLAGGLRAWLEDAASLVVQARGQEAPALHMGTRQLVEERCDPLPAREAACRDREPVGLDIVTTCLVHALFRQMITTGSVPVADPLGDALGALDVDPRQSDMVERVADMGADERRSLAAVLSEHVVQLRTLTPPLQPGWLPRTGDRVAIPLAGGRVVLHGTFDLLIGAPAPETASLCAVELTTTGPWARARRKLHLLALLETLRSGTPPFRLALLHSGAGRYGVEDVREEHLGAVVSHIAARLAEVADAHH
jgi:hypothetical protein